MSKEAELANGLFKYIKETVTEASIIAAGTLRITPIEKAISPVNEEKDEKKEDDIDHEYTFEKADEVDEELDKMDEAMLDEKDDKWMQSAFARNKGGLHRSLKVPEDEKIPVTKMRAALRSKNPKLRKRAQAAVNANPDTYGSLKKKKNEGKEEIKEQDSEELNKDTQSSNWLSTIDWAALEKRLEEILGVKVTVEPYLDKSRYSQYLRWRGKENLLPNAGVFKNCLRALGVESFSSSTTDEIKSHDSYWCTAHLGFEIKGGGSNGIRILTALFSFKTKKWEFRVDEGKIPQDSANSAEGGMQDLREQDAQPKVLGKFSDEQVAKDYAKSKNAEVSYDEEKKVWIVSTNESADDFTFGFLKSVQAAIQKEGFSVEPMKVARYLEGLDKIALEAIKKAIETNDQEVIKQVITSLVESKEK